MKKILLICSIILSIGVASAAKTHDNPTPFDAFLAKKPVQSTLTSGNQNRNSCQSGCFQSYLNCLGGGVPVSICRPIFVNCLNFCERIGPR